jgi:TonB family protein
LSGIFISYRRNDSQGEAGRLFDDLVQRFDENTVFMDVAAIEAGRDFRKAIEEGVTKCGVLLVVIGLEWLSVKDEHGTRRLDDPGDFVRIETASALKRDIPVIPVLVRGAKMPTAEQLPDDLKELAFRNCIELSHARWKSDIQLLIDALRRLPGMSGIRPSTGTGRTLKHPEKTASFQAEGEGLAAIDPADIERVSRELALCIGPIAFVVVRRAAASCASMEDLYLKVVEEIDSREERARFLKGSPLSSIPPPEPGTTISKADSALPWSAAEKSGLPFKTVALASPAGLSTRWKYGLIAGGAAILLVFLILLLRPTIREQPSSQNARTARPEESASQSAEAKDSSPFVAVGPRVASAEPKNVETKRAAAKSAETGSVEAGKDETRREGSKLPQRVRVPPDVSSGLLIKEVQPVYPPLARQANVSGMVVLDVDISRDGAVEAVRMVQGHPLLVSAAIDAVKQWRYKPLMLNGQPTAMTTQVSVNFTLKGGS